MVRVLNFFCVALMGITILALYHVSEKTRVAHMELASVNRQIAGQRSAIAVMQTEWGRAAAPDRVQKLAAAQGMNDAASAQLSSFEQLPRRGEDAPLNNSPLRNANAELPAQPMTSATTPAPMSAQAPAPPGF